MRQRLGIAAALLRKPRLLMLDEPATGLDPGGMRDMRDLIRELSASGMTVLLSSHLLAEVEELCNRVAIVRSGRIAYQGSLAELRAQAGESYLLRSSDEERALAVLSAQPGIEEVVATADGTRFGARDEAAVGALSLALAEAGAADPRAEPPARHPRGPLLQPHRGDTVVETRRTSQSDAEAASRATVEAR